MIHLGAPISEYEAQIRYDAVMDTLTTIVLIIVVLAIWYGATKKEKK